jgi:S-adenosylmethionine:tRNA ribosyltransferase-isomerase
MGFYRDLHPTTVGCMKKDPRSISVEAFDYELPPAQIALYPLPIRDQSSLLVYKKGEISDRKYYELPECLPNESWLVFNQTKVVPARLIFEKESGGLIEIFCLAPEQSWGDMSLAIQSNSPVQMQCLVGGASKWKAGLVLKKQLDDITLYASIVRKEEEHFIIEFNWEAPLHSFASILLRFGQVPLPPYLKRKTEKEDLERYQTVYAAKEGSVAAPTAGLHFTPALLEKLQQQPIEIDQLTLHVGAGTFKPVKAARIEEHAMHAEWIEVELAFLQRWLQRIDKPLIAVGTTSLRTLESLYWIGLKMMRKEFVTIPSLSQWECYELEEHSVPLKEVLVSLINWLQKNKQTKLLTQTSLLIGPGYQFKTAIGLLTNFHQPKSTLLLLVAAFIGDDWKKVYAHALQHNYRMLSYGDGSLLWRNE